MAPCQFVLLLSAKNINVILPMIFAKIAYLKVQEIQQNFNTCTNFLKNHKRFLT